MCSAACVLAALTGWYDRGQTRAVKIGISLPDELFREVEKAAARMGLSRSELLARAAEEFLLERRRRDITASYDRAFGPAAGATDDDAFRREATRRALLDVEW